MNRPRIVVRTMVAITLGIALLATMPTLFPAQLGFLPAIRVDTDPENMLASDEPVRTFHHAAKARFGLHDVLVVGIVNEQHPEGIFNPQTLAAVHSVTAHAMTLEGVIPSEVMSLSTLDNIENTGPGSVSFGWLMENPPTSDKEALAVRDRAMRLPFLRDTLVSGDGRAVAVYVPLAQKDDAHEVATALQEHIDTLEAGDAEFHLAGLPVAEDTFGVEMFKQMAISAPVAMLIIFLLMWVFFRKLIVIVSPMVVAMVSAIMTMGALVATGNTIHIMSSMIPIFIMPIAVLDAVHIISDFFERYREGGDRRAIVASVMRHLFTPMLFTSLTTTAGFASLALTPIPPVQVFGLFVGIGVLLAWFWTITFVPAFLLLIPEKWLKGFGSALPTSTGDERLGGLLGIMSRATYRHARLILLGTLVVVGVAGYGITKINVNDNPTKWFEPSHPIRVADRVLNAHFGGTYNAYLTFDYQAPAYTPAGYGERLKAFATASDAAQQAAFTELAGWLAAATGDDPFEVIDAADAQVRAKRTAATEASQRSAWDSAGDFLAQQFGAAEAAEDSEVAYELAALPAAARSYSASLSNSYQELADRIGHVAGASPASDKEFRTALAASTTPPILQAFVAEAEQLDHAFKDPALLAYIEALQAELLRSGVVGKSNSLADIVKTVHRDLVTGDQADYRIPATRFMVAQTLAQYQSSHRKDDLWHFVTPNYEQSLIWVQLTSGDNSDMEELVSAVNAYVAANPPPVKLSAPQWFGLTYINVVWQDKMVTGMVEAFFGSFVVVLIMMILLFRSVLWGLLSMIPLTVTVGLIYGLTGLLGKDYDMPVAVLSSLSLGLAVDYAIHFLARARDLNELHGDWQTALRAVFAEPARAITRNVVVVGLGFLPLVLAPLVPYQTVGILIAAILITAGGATLVLLPALITVLKRWALRPSKSHLARAVTNNPRS